MPRKKSEADVEFDVQVGARIEAARKRQSITQRRLEALCGLSRGQLYWYEVGRSSCPINLLAKIASALNVELTSLMPNTR